MRAIDVMTSHVMTAAPQMTVQDAAKLLINSRISGIPVVDGDRRLVGIVSRADLLRVLASGGANSTDDERDGPIRSRLLADLCKQRWANCSESDIVVSDGVVHFWGVVGSEDERRALRIAAENTPGVRGVEDHTISGPLRPGPLFPLI